MLDLNLLEKKQNSRKRSNNKKEPVTATVNLLDNSDTSQVVFPGSASFHIPYIPQQQMWPIHQQQSIQQQNHIQQQQQVQQQQVQQQHMQQLLIQEQQQQNQLKFFLKWVNGTKISKCYGCNEKIHNPPKSPPDDLVIAVRDYRHFRDPVTGMMRFTENTQNIHFHLRSVCVMVKYREFNHNWINVPKEMEQTLLPVHIQRLQNEFAWNIV
jgi:hypothetical protein